MVAFNFITAWSPNHFIILVQFDHHATNGWVQIRSNNHPADADNGSFCIAPDNVAPYAFLISKTTLNFNFLTTASFDHFFEHCLICSENPRMLTIAYFCAEHCGGMHAQAVCLAATEKYSFLLKLINSFGVDSRSFYVKSFYCMPFTAKTHTTSKIGAASFGVLHKLAAKTLTAVNGGATVVT